MQSIIIKPQLSPLTGFGVINISGVDAVKFLQGQITINSETIEANKLNLAALCNHQGRCIALFFITKQAQGFELILAKDTIETTIAHLKKYAVFFKVEINELLDSTQLLGVNGIKSEVVNELFTNEQVNWLNQDLAIIKVSESCYSNTIQNVEPNDLYELSDEQGWLYALALSGTPWLKSSSQSHFLPHNINLPKLQAVDFKKGCFTGQEVIARMQYKGKLKSHMQLLQCQSVEKIEAKMPIYLGDKVAGEVICGATGNNQESALLAVIKDRYLQGENFRLNSEKGSILKIIQEY